MKAFPLFFTSGAIRLALVGGLLLAGGLAWGASSAATQSTSPGQIYAPTWERQLESDSTGAPLARFQLDASLFAHTRADFADLRLFDGLGKPLGLKVRPVNGIETHCRQESVSMRRVSLNMLGDSAFEAVFIAEDSARLPDRISVAVEDRNFEISLSLWTAPSLSFAKPNQAAWTPRLKDFALFDYSRFVDLRREEAGWDRTKDQAVRLRVSGLTQVQRSLVSTLSTQAGRPDGESYQMERRLLRVEAISFHGEVCSSQRGGSLTDSAELGSNGFAHPIPEPEVKRSWYVFPAGRLPIRALEFRMGTRNFMRSIVLTGWQDSVLAPADTQLQPWTWPRITAGRLHRIDWGGQADSNLRLALEPMGRYATLALGIQDNDDEPLALQGILAESERMEAVFPTQAEGPYTVRYGDPIAAPMHFDFENLLPRVLESRLDTYRLAAARGLEIAAPLDPSGLSWLTGERLLTGGMALAIGVLVLLVLRVARKAGR